MSIASANTSKLAVPALDEPTEHVAGEPDANVSIVQYGDYGCSDCAQLHNVLSNVLEDDDVSFAYVFRHLPRDPGTGDRLDRAIASEAAARQDRFWEMHAALFRHAENQQEGISLAVAEAGLDQQRFELDRNDPQLKDQIVQEIDEARANGINRVPTLLIRGKEYDGAWDSESIKEAIAPPVGKRVKEIAVEFADWAAASGAILVLFATIALIWRNSPLGQAYEEFWQIEAGVVAAGRSLVMSLHHWVNDLFMAVFFLIVGLELKRELLSGQLADIRQAIFPAAAALGGMVIPAGIYLLFNLGTGTTSGWGVPMATDIAFTLGVLALLGSRVPTSLKVFATALAIVDDLGAILVLAIAYNHGISWIAIGVAALMLTLLIAFNRARIYALWPYLMVGLLLWVAVYFSGLHATLAGVLLAAAIPTRGRAPLRPLLAQERVSAKQAEQKLGRGEHQEEQERQRLADRMQTLDRRLHPPAEKLEHTLQPWSAYFVLPIFALANAGIALSTQSISLTGPATLGIVIGLVAGKPLGILAGTWLAHRTGLGQKPDDATWSQVFGVGCLCGIGFTMSIFISTEAFAAGPQLAAAKFAVMIGSITAALLGILWLTFFSRRSDATQDRPDR